MHQTGPAHLSARKIYISGLTRCAYDAGEIQEVTIVGGMTAWKLKATMLSVDYGHVVIMGIVQCKHGLRECPRGGNGYTSQSQMVVPYRDL